MGSGHSVFTEKELKEYQDLTYLTKKEILIIYKRFWSIDPVAVEGNRDARLESQKIMDLPELKVNPFRDRIVKVFSSSNDGNMTFEDFLDMMSVFSDAAEKDVKVEYAFKIYDFDDDNFIGREDLNEMILRLTGVKPPASAAGPQSTNTEEEMTTDLDEADVEQAATIHEEDTAEEAKLSSDDIEKLIDNILKEADLDEDQQLSFAEFEHVISKTPDFMNSFRIRI